jgi:hypothetical protein
MSEWKKLRPFIRPTGVNGWVLPCCTFIFICTVGIYIGMLMGFE